MSELSVEIATKDIVDRPLVTTNEAATSADQQMSVAL